MEIHVSDQMSASDRILGTSIAAFSIAAVGFSAFVVGYTLTRTSLQQSSTHKANTVHSVVPHEATLWQDVGQ